MANPAFNNNPVFNGRATTATEVTPENLQRMYDAPAATPQQMQRMTFDDTMIKIVTMLAVVIGAGVLTWVGTLVSPLVALLMIPAAIVALVTGIWQSFKREPSIGLIMTYSVAEGVLLGGFTSFLEARFPGIALQALLATAAVFATVLILFMNGKVRTSPRLTKIFLVAAGGYLLFSLLNFGLVLFGAFPAGSMFGIRSMTVFGVPIGLVIGLLAVVMGAYSLVMDFEYIQRGINAGAPRRYGWIGAFGLVVTIIWLYTEIIRIIAILRNN